MFITLICSWNMISKLYNNLIPVSFVSSDKYMSTSYNGTGWRKRIPFSKTYSKTEKIYTGKYLLVILMYHTILKMNSKFLSSRNILENFRDTYEHNYLEFSRYLAYQQFNLTLFHCSSPLPIFMCYQKSLGIFFSLATSIGVAATI